jgi:integrase
MANLFVTIVKNLQLKDGKHTVRIAVTHNGQTRYIPTDIKINSESEIKNGRIVKRIDKDILNIKLQKIMYKLEERLNSIEYPDCLTCSQLIKMLKGPAVGEKHRTFREIANEYISQIDESDRSKTNKMYRIAVNRYLSYVGESSLMEQTTPIRINNYITLLSKEGLSSTTINIYITLLKVVINYAKKMRYVDFRVDPFITAKIPSAKKRETHITIEQLKAIRDAKLTKHNISVVRDIFMLTYYLAGMNLVDMLAYDFRNTTEINYIRKKTRNTKEGNSIISFTIPDEAFPIIYRYMDKRTGHLILGKYKNYTSCYNVLNRKLPELAKIAGINHYFTLYSARKSFVQHGFDIGIPLSTLEYCIGQSMKEDRPIFNYVTIMQRHADKAIREILDNLK